MVHSTPAIQLGYEKGWYTININFDKEGTVVTQGKTMDELIKNIDEALECHFGKKGYEVSLNIPIITFSRYRQADAINLGTSK